jgi:hypothetical protein
MKFKYAIKNSEGLENAGEGSQSGCILGKTSEMGGKRDFAR